MYDTKTLTRIAELAAQAGNERTNIDKIIAEAAGLFNTEMALAFGVDRQGNLRHLAGLGVPPHSIRKIEEAGSPGWATGLMGTSLVPLVIHDPSTNPPAEAVGTWATLLNASTITLIPLHTENRAHGVLALYHKEPHSYTSDECDALQVIAALLAVLVARASVAEADAATSKSQLFSVLSHELRTPLTSIMGFTQLIRKRVTASGNSDSRLLEQLDVLWAQAQRLNRLIDTFVDMARIERGEFEITQGQVELTTLLKSAGEQALAQASSHHALEMDIPDEPLWLHGDKKRLEQAFGHVISNAIRYSPQDRPVIISCKRNDAEKMAIVEIVDQGPGIPAARLKEVFDRTYPSGPLRSGGLGVGLYLSKVIVEAHGGHISIRSGTGEGTRVSIELPL